jgi:hypothetical protein
VKSLRIVEFWSHRCRVCIAWVFVTNTRKGTHFSITMEHADSSMPEEEEEEEEEDTALN